MNYLKAVAIALDILANAFTGGQPYQTISCRIGESIRDGKWASKVPWPGFLRAHFLASVFDTTV